MVTPKKVDSVSPNRPLVGTDYLYRSGAVRSLMQLRRLEKSGRITPWFKLGSRRVQYKDVLDRDIAKLITEAERASAA